MNTVFTHAKMATLAAALLLVVAPAWAQWELDNAQSELNFISIKNASVAETHRFGTLSGTISSAGKVQLSIDLDSVDTMIDIRNKRMREYLFETVRFPAAIVTAEVDTDLLERAANGGTVAADVPVQLALHGLQQTLTVPMLVVGSAGGELRVISARPVTVNAAAFALTDGIARLQEIAGLASISSAVPVSLNLSFRRAD